MRKKIRVPIYDLPIIIHVTDNVGEVAEKIDGVKDDSVIENEATVLIDKIGITNLVIKPDANINTICHESFHIMVNIMDDVGMTLSDSSEEAYAYLIGWVSEKINETIIAYNNKK